MFILIPEKVDQDKDLNPNSKRLMGHIISLNHSSLGCIADNNYLAKKIGVTERMITNYIKSLKDKEYILIGSKSIGRKNNTIRILLPSPKILLSMNEVNKNINLKVKNYNKNQLTDDIKSDWLDDYIENL